MNQPVPSKLYSYIGEPGENEIVIKINGEPIEAILSNGFVVIDQEWDKLTEIEIDFPMKIRWVIADKQVNDLTNKVALERGPLVYALEEIDNTIDVFDIALNDETQLAVEQHPALFNGIELITGAVDTGDKFTAIPYYAWGHRGGGKMTVWMNHK